MSEDIKKIIDETLESHYKKRSYRFTREHPALVENLVTIFGVIAIISVCFTIAIAYTIDEKSQGIKSLEKAIIKSSNCQELKNIVHTLHDDSDYTDSLIISEITIKC